MHLGTEGLGAARWTAQIHDEWTRNLLQDRPDLTPEQLARTRQQMQLALPNAEAEDFESLIDTLSLPDPEDRHVLAAAVHTGAELIVTQNLKHFPAQALTLHGLEALTPDALPVAGGRACRHQRGGGKAAGGLSQAALRHGAVADTPG